LPTVSHLVAAGDRVEHGLVVLQPSRDWSTKAILTVEPIFTLPLSGCSLPVIMRNSVDLPAPFGPMMRQSRLRGP